MAIFRSGQEVTASVWTENYPEGLSFAVFLAFGSSDSATDAPMLTKPILIRHEGLSMVEASLRAHAPGFLRRAKPNLNLHRFRWQVAMPLPRPCPTSSPRSPQGSSIRWPSGSRPCCRSTRCARISPRSPARGPRRVRNRNKRWEAFSGSPGSIGLFGSDCFAREVEQAVEVVLVLLIPCLDLGGEAVGQRCREEVEAVEDIDDLPLCFEGWGGNLDSR